MLTKAPAGVGSVRLLDYTSDGSSYTTGCFQVQSGRDKDTRYQVVAGHYLLAYLYGDSSCSSFKGMSNSRQVSQNLSTTNFWFSLS